MDKAKPGLANNKSKERDEPSTSKQKKNIVPSTSRTSRSHPDIFQLELPEVTRQKRTKINHKLNNTEPTFSSVESLNSEASTSRSSSAKHKVKKFRKNSKSPTQERTEEKEQWSETSTSSRKSEKHRIRYVYNLYLIQKKFASHSHFLYIFFNNKNY